MTEEHVPRRLERWPTEGAILFVVLRKKNHTSARLGRGNSLGDLQSGPSSPAKNKHRMGKFAI